MASLDVRSAHDVAKPSMVSRILAHMGTHGHVVGALLEEMKDVRGSPCFDNCETEFRYSRCTRQGSVEAPVLWGKVAKKRTVESRKEWKSQGMGESCSEEKEMTNIDSVA